jgi:hypothetical protein
MNVLHKDGSRDTFGAKNISIYREGRLLSDQGQVTLEPGANHLGIEVWDLKGGYVDFYRVNVVHNYAEISPDPVEGEAGEDLAMSASLFVPVENARYEWDFGDGTPKENLSLEADHVFSEEGNYTVTLTVYDSEDNVAATGEAEARIDAGGTPTPEPGAGQWVLKLTQPNGREQEGETTFWGDSPCDVKTEVSSTASGAQTATTGSCDWSEAIPTNEVTTHTWTQPPATLLPGQVINGTVTVSQSGFCWIFREPAYLEPCLQGARTTFIVSIGSGTAADGQFSPGSWVYDGRDMARASDKPTASFTWKVPEGSPSNNTIMIEARAQTSSSLVSTYFYYEWQTR